MMYQKYTDYAIEKTLELLAIDSPTGYTAQAADYMMEELQKLGYAPFKTVKGGVGVDLGGKDAAHAVMIAAHIDTLGGMVCEIKSNGRLRITNLGGLKAVNCETENCRIVTKKNGAYEGTLQLCNPSAHVNTDLQKTERDFKTTEIVVDEDVKTAEDVKALGISVGDFVCFDPRPRVTRSGYIKSRYLDDKLSVGCVLALAKYLKDEKIEPEKKIYAYFTVYEEVGHGCSQVPFENVTEALSVDMGCVGDGITCTERQVSICAKDTSGPYSYEMVCKLIEAAEKTGADYAVDVYPNYGSDVEASLRGGLDAVHGLIGPGVYASHGYERSHRDGAENTIKVLVGYVAP